MGSYNLTGPAEAQIDEILEWSQRKFGDHARARYAELIVTAMEDVSEDPGNANIMWRRVSSADLGIYHIEHSRDHVPDPPGRVKQPRHRIVFRINQAGGMDILGVIHDRMLPTRALRRIVRANREER